MENRANYAIVGLFTLAVIAGIFGFVFWFTRASENSDRKVFRVVFVGSVSGLSTGSAVRFNGLRVGEVTAVNILPSDPSRVVALIGVNPSTPIKTDTRARLETQGLTGVANIQLTGGAGNTPDLVSLDAGAPPTIFADRSDYQDILETVQRVAGKLDSVLTRADNIMAQGEGTFLSTLRNVETFTRTLDADKINRSLDGVDKFASMLGRNADNIDRTIREITAKTDTITRAIDRLDNVMAGAESFFGGGQDGATAGLIKELTDAAKAIQTLAGNLDIRTRELSSGLSRFTGPGLRDFEALAADSRKAVNDLSRAVRALERNPSQLLFGGQSNIPEYRR